MNILVNPRVFDLVSISATATPAMDRSARIGRRAGVTPEEEETGAVDRNRVISTSDRKTVENVDLAWTVVSSRRLGGRPKRLVCKEPTDVGVRVLGLRPGCSDDREGIRDESSWDFDLREGVRVELTAPGVVGERSRGVVADKERLDPRSTRRGRLCTKIACALRVRQVDACWCWLCAQLGAVHYCDMLPRLEEPALPVCI